MTMTIDIKEITKVNLKPNDVIIIHIKENLYAYQYEHIDKIFKSAFPNNKVVVIDNILSIEAFYICDNYEGNKEIIRK